MSEAEFNKKIDEWVETVNKHKGEETVPWPAPYPVHTRNYYSQQAIEWVTEDIIRHFCAGLGERNPLFWSHDYAKTTRWGDIIAPPTFTDSIAISWATKLEPPPVSWWFPTMPAGNKRELFGVIRPGDRMRTLDKWLGLEERKTREPRPFRLFFDTTQKSYINQKDEVVARVTMRYARLVTSEDPTGKPLFVGADRAERHKFTDEELEPIYRAYDENKRRGADTLYWEDVAVGNEVPTLAVGPYCAQDSVAFHAGQQGHCVAFDTYWERMKAENINVFKVNPETNLYWSIPYVHAGDGPYGLGFGLGYQFEGLLGRLLSDWMGDDGFLKVLDCRFRVYPIMGDVFYMKGNVTNKSSEGDEHLVDLDVGVENQDGTLIVPGTAQVRLPSRT